MPNPPFFPKSTLRPQNPSLSCSTLLILVVLLIQSVALAQNPATLTDKDGKIVLPTQHNIAPEPPPEHPATPPESRHYNAKRLRTLEEHERFNFQSIPPGFSPRTWALHPAQTESYDRGYDDGYNEGWREAQQTVAIARGASVYAQSMNLGENHFRDGKYGAAVRDFLLAATLEQGDPICRIRAAHAMTALGHYEDAALLLNRAYELQPKLVYIPFDLRHVYGIQSDLNIHMTRLQKHADAQTTPDAENPRSAASRSTAAKTLALLGYYRYYTGDAAAAHLVLKRARSLDPRNKFASSLLETARLTTPAR